MSTVTSSPATPPAARRRAPTTPRAVLLDVLVVLVWSVVAGVVGAVVWSQVVTLPLVTRSGNAAAVTPDQLVKEVGLDGWYFVIAAVGGLLAGLVLMALRRRDPLLMVLLVTLGAGLSAWLMLRLGTALGPGDEVAALRKLGDGDTAPMRLTLHATGVAWTWPVLAALGALVDLWVLHPADRGDRAPQAAAGPDTGSDSNFDSGDHEVRER